MHSLCRLHLIGLWSGLVHREQWGAESKTERLCVTVMLKCCVWEVKTIAGDLLIYPAREIFTARGPVFYFRTLTSSSVRLHTEDCAHHSQDAFTHWVVGNQDCHQWILTQNWGIFQVITGENCIFSLALCLLLPLLLFAEVFLCSQVWLSRGLWTQWTVIH